MLENKKAYVVLASGGTKVGSDIDYAGRYLEHALGFVGITDMTVLAAYQLMIDPAKREVAVAETLKLAV